MNYVLRDGRIIDPTSKRDEEADLVIENGRVTRIGRGLRAPAASREIHCKGLLVTPGFVDLHTHLREPGQEYKEDIASGTRAAAAGGFATVCCMANTIPVNDCRAVTDLIVRRAREVGVTRVFPVGAITKGLAGAELSEMAEMREAGIVAVSDDGLPVMNAELMRRALEYARTFGLPVVQHCEDKHLAAGGVMNESASSTRAGLKGQPSAAESVMVARDLELVALTGARYHVAHVSAAASVRLLREARKRGLPVTCEVTPHHLTLTDVVCCGYDTATKVAPPLRTQADIDALKEALADGTIDAVATDHAPHSLVEKDVEFDLAAFGMVGLETALPLLLGLVEDNVITLERAVYLLTAGPAQIFAFPEAFGTLIEGVVADVTIIDPAAGWTVQREALLSKSKNTPFHGRAVRGRVKATLVGGRIAYDGSGELAQPGEGKG